MNHASLTNRNITVPIKNNPNIIIPGPTNKKLYINNYYINSLAHLTCLTLNIRGITCTIRSKLKSIHKAYMNSVAPYFVIWHYHDYRQRHLT